MSYLSEVEAEAHTRPVVVAITVAIVGVMTIVTVGVADPATIRAIVVAARVTDSHTILMPVIAPHAIAIAEAITARFD